MSKRDKHLKERFNVQDTLKIRPEDVCAIYTLNFRTVAQLVYVPLQPDVPYGVKLIEDMKPHSETDDLNAFVTSYAHIIALQENKNFIPLTKTKKRPSGVESDLYVSPEFVQFFFCSADKTFLMVNGEFETTDRKSIRDFRDGIEKSGQPDDWIEFSSKTLGTVFLNRHQPIADLIVSKDALTIVFAHPRFDNRITACFPVANPEALAQEILEKTTTPPPHPTGAAHLQSQELV